jgi:hypothetical protein
LVDLKILLPVLEMGMTSLFTKQRRRNHFCSC